MGSEWHADQDAKLVSTKEDSKSTEFSNNTLLSSVCSSNWVALLFGSFGIFGFRSKFCSFLIKNDQNLIRNRQNFGRKAEKTPKLDQKWPTF